MSRLIKEKRGQFVIIAALLIAALTLATAISIHEININRQSITYRPVDELLLGTTSDMNRALTVALANYTDGIANNKTSIVEANYTAYRTASQFMTTWKESVLTAYSSYGIRINHDMTPRFEIGPWNESTPWWSNSTFSFAYIPYGLDVDSYGFKGWIGATEKYVQLQIFSATVETNLTTGSTNLRFQLMQSVVNGNYSTPIPDLPSSPDNATFRIGAYNVTSQSFNATSPSNLTYLGGGNYSVTFNQAIDPIHNGVRLDLATPEDKIWISAFNYNYDPYSSNTTTQLSNSTVTLGRSVTDSVTVTGRGVGYPVPTGTVTFQFSTDGGSNWTAFGAVKTLSGGSATSDSYTPFSAGTYYFRAVYSGDSNYQGSQSGDALEPLAVNVATPTVATLLSPPTVKLNQSVTDSVAVAGLGGVYPVPTGNVTFEVSTDGGSNWTAFGSVKTLSGGSATSDSYTPVAESNDSVSYFFRANYLGDSNYNLTQSGVTEEPLTVTIGLPPSVTTTQTQLSNSNITLGQSVSDNATVTGIDGYSVWKRYFPG